MSIVERGKWRLLQKLDACLCLCGDSMPTPPLLQVHGGATSHQQEEAGPTSLLLAVHCGQALCLSAPPSR